jgi:DNA-binding beta-propeller fold protein YncE
VANSEPFLYGLAAPSTVWIFNGATCDSTVTSGCDQTATTVPVGAAAYDIAVDQASNAVYVVNFGDDSVTVINGTTCNATVTSGCGRRLTVQVGGVPVAVGVSAATHTAYVANNADADVSVFGP